MNLVKESPILILSALFPLLSIYTLESHHIGRADIKQHWCIHPKVTQVVATMNWPSMNKPGYIHR